MKTVFVFGAGASRMAGAPLMFDFLDKASVLLRRKRIGDRAAFEDVFNAISELRAIHDKSYLDLENIETLFGAIEMGQLIGKLADRNQASIDNLRSSIITLIVQTLETSIEFPVASSSRSPIPPPPYDDFANMIHELSKNSQIHQPLFGFLTFNYDLALDFALAYYSIRHDYCLSDKPDQSVYPLLKLHGSINWGTCQECKRIIPWNMRDLQFNAYPEKYYLIDLGSKIGKVQHCGKPLQGPPVLVPPTWNKQGYHTELAHVWRTAAQELALAENIFVIGYSLPETDSFFRYLFALGTESPTRIKRLWVINPDRQGDVEQRFRSMIGRGVEKRLRFLKGDEGKFENAIQVMREALQED